MNTYDLPEEPEGPLWGPTEDGEGWIEYWRETGPAGRWYKAKYAGTKAMYTTYTWWELLGSGPLVDEDPRITLQTLADQVVEAARKWRRVNLDRPGDAFRKHAFRVSARDVLGRAVDAYERKAKQ